MKLMLVAAVLRTLTLVVDLFASDEVALDIEPI